MYIDKIIELISKFLALIIVLPIHEFAHAFVAVKCGDVTPKLYNRYTVNPFAHFDTIGLISFLIAGFGWAKPVPINPNNFNHYKRDSFLVSIAGVSANYILAFIAYPLSILTLLFVPEFGYFTDVLYLTLIYVFSFSLSFFVFNLIPIYPLDGFRAIDSFTKKRGKIYWFLKTKGIYVLYALFALSIFADITSLWQFDLLGLFIGFIVNYIQIPITWVWGLIFGGILY